MVENFYAEPLLALCLCLALADVTGRESPGEVGLSFWLLLAGAAWVKPEGAAVFALAAVALPLLVWRQGRDGRAALRQVCLARVVGLVLAVGFLCGAVSRMVLASELLDLYVDQMRRIFRLPAMFALFACFPRPNSTQNPS